MALNIDTTFEGKLTCAFKNDRNYGKFSTEHVRKSKNWRFDGVLLSKVENVRPYNLHEFCVMAKKNDTKLKQELTCQFKIDLRNLTSFEPSTRKSQKFAL